MELREGPPRRPGRFFFGSSDFDDNRTCDSPVFTIISIQVSIKIPADLTHLVAVVHGNVAHPP